MKALVVSLHDVSPRTRPECETILAALASLGIRSCSLLVIPNHHHRGHFLQDPDFCQWLRGLLQEGHEIVMHGYYHQRPRRRAESMTAQLTTRFYTADEGEFYDLEENPSRERVAQAREEFRSAGLDPAGFIAPAWLLSAGAQSALRALGFSYTTRLGSVFDLQNARSFASQSLVWSVRSAWRRATSLAWNACLARVLTRCPLLRISIHPVDWSHAAVKRQILDLAGKTIARREALTYQQWVARQRTAPF